MKSRSPIIYPGRLLLSDFAKIFVEIGFGGGDFLLELAKSNPDTLLVGFEIKNRRFDNLVRRVSKNKIANVQLVQFDGETALAQIFGGESVDAIFTLFPDPWPKRKHQKNRIWSADFFRLCHHLLKRGGKLYLATDDGVYLKQAMETLANVSTFTPTNPWLIETHYARKWKKAGRPLHYHCFSKSTPGNLT